MTRLRRGAGPGQLSLLELLELLWALPDAAGCGGGVEAGTPQAGAAQQPEFEAAGLGEWERQVLAFAIEHHLAGRYDLMVRQHLGCSSTRYLQALSRLLDRPEVLAAQPELVGRLRALRDRRQRLRAQSRSPQKTWSARSGRPRSQGGDRRSLSRSGATSGGARPFHAD